MDMIPSHVEDFCVAGGLDRPMFQSTKNNDSLPQLILASSGYKEGMALVAR